MNKADEKYIDSLEKRIRELERRVSLAEPAVRSQATGNLGNLSDTPQNSPHEGAGHHLQYEGYECSACIDEFKRVRDKSKLEGLELALQVCRRGQSPGKGCNYCVGCTEIGIERGHEEQCELLSAIRAEMEKLRC